MKVTVRITRDVRGGFDAWCPALPGCAVWGESRDEARRKIHRAVRGYLAHINQALPRELARLAGLH